MTLIKRAYSANRKDNFSTKSNISKYNAIMRKASPPLANDNNYRTNLVSRSRLYMFGTFILLTTIISSVYYLLYVSNFLIVDNFIISGAHTYVSEEDLHKVLAERALGKNIISLNTSDIQTDLTKVFQGAKNISLVKKYPRGIFVNVVERSPIAVVKSQEDSYFIDEDGYVLGISDANSNDLPIIEYAGVVKIGFFINKDILPVYLDMLNAFYNQNLNPSSMSFSDNTIDVFFENGVNAKLLVSQNKYNAASLISNLLLDVSPEGKPAKKIDLRYDRVIVSYE